MTLNRRRFIAGAAGAITLATTIGRAAATTPETQVLGGSAFGTYWRAVLPTSADHVAVSAAVTAVVEAIDASMSPYRADSEITRFNLRRTAGATEASPDLCTVAGESLRIARLSGGAFEPTIGPLVHRYGFGPISGGLGSYAGIGVGDGLLDKSDSALTLDLCGVAKGHALDRIVATLVTQGLSDVFIELGGEVKAAGTHPSGRDWQVGVEVPGAPQLAFQHVVRLDGNALATSGVTANGVADHRFSHIIDPRTQAPVDNGVLSVSVLAPTAMEADALATALLVMGTEEGGRLATALGRPALFIEAGTERRETMVAGFADHVLT